MTTPTHMKRNYLVLTAIALVLGTAFFGCKKDDPTTVAPKITDDRVEVTETSATFTWTVDWIGNRVSVVEVSEHEDMRESQFYGSEEELNKENFRVTVTGLKESTKYYYRYWVWNHNYLDHKFVMEEKIFSTSVTPQTPNVVINGVFSISDSQRVWFSKGNLQYIGSVSKPYWKFADNQWDFLGITSGQNSIASSVDRDLFGWGTSGYHDEYDGNNVHYQPYSTSNSIVNSPCNTYGYGPSTNMPDINLTGSSVHYDWGVYNAISNGGNQAGLWRTLTKDEWAFVFNTRSASTVEETNNARFVKATVNEKAGIILFPDIYTHPSYLPRLLQVNKINATYTTNNFSGNGWAVMENLGCVFLPAAGYRNGTSVDNVGSYGGYWSASYSNSSSAYRIHFSASGMSSEGYDGRCLGYSVRLVRDAQ